MIKQVISPPDFMPSVYGPKPRPRAAELDGMASLRTRDLFPDMADKIYDQGDDLSIIREATRQALAGVNTDMIRPDNRVNLLASEHGFAIFGGYPYCEMLKTIRDFVRERTGCENLRLRLAMYRGFREADEVVEQYRLDREFEHIAAVGPFDKGVPIETEIGTLYGVARAYDADRFIHAYYDDPREVYFHRLVHRALKAFVMSYARCETRSVYHSNFGNRSANFIQKALFDSPFVQERYAFSCILRSSPAGIIGIDGDNDLYAIDRRINLGHLRDFGKMRELFASIDDCVAVLDGGRWGYYLHAGGLCFGVFINGSYDPFDLTQPAAFGYFDVLNKTTDGKVDIVMTINPAIKAVVINQAWPGIPFSDVPMLAPTFVVGSDHGELLRRDAANPFFMDFAQTSDTLEQAIDAASSSAGTDKLLVFDGSFGNITLSPSLAEELIEKAPDVGRRVDEELLPMWLAQRGIDP